MKSTIVVALVMILTFSLSANNVEITELTQTGNTISFEISWENSWRSTLEFHDAVWIFVKQAPNGSPSWLHTNISSGITEQDFELEIPSDGVGVFIRRAFDDNGTSSAQVQLTLANPIGAYRDYKVFATEMVYIPEGSFDIGDGVSSGRVHRGDDPSLSFNVTSEAAIPIGNTANDINSVTNLFGIITAISSLPAEFPKGYASFYIMKYNITQKQYVDFLNCLHRATQDSLTNSDLSASTITNNFVMTDSQGPIRNNGISCSNDIGAGEVEFFCDLNNNGIPNEIDDGQSKICSYLSYRAIAAYADWAGLGPMTFMEYEKACTGPLPAIPGEFAWGSPTLNSVPVSALQNLGEDSEGLIIPGSVEGGYFYGLNIYRAGLFAVDSQGNRLTSGASYYGVMDLTSSGSNSSTRDIGYFNGATYGNIYEGQHGDGNLPVDSYADFDNEAVKLTSNGIGNTTDDGQVSFNSTYTTPHSAFLVYTTGRLVRRL